MAYVLADDQRMLRLIGRRGRMTEGSLDRGLVPLRFTRRPDRDREPSEPAPANGR